MHEDSWSRNNVGGIMKQESSRRNTEGESWRRKHGGVILEEETFSKPGVHFLRIFMHSECFIDVNI